MFIVEEESSHIHDPTLQVGPKQPLRSEYRYHKGPIGRLWSIFERQCRQTGKAYMFVCPCLIHFQGHTNNLVHPTLSRLIIDFFYSGDSSVGQLFPKVFTAEVPRIAVAISATAVILVLLYFATDVC